ncbi:MAG: type II secretion system F family protein [Phycisphaeraceae bacterium]|nr:MAG: type II secretion system F family protein [Phycisphaeraceae bacterium]
MPTFEYIAIDAHGARTTGVLAGNSEQAVFAELESRQMTPVKLAEQAEHADRGGVGTRQLATVYAQMADLLRAGVPLLRALTLLSRQKSRPRVASVFRRLAERVSDGGELADAMAEQPGVFRRVHVAMVRAGEKGGFLEDVFKQLGQFVLSEAELKSKIVGGLIYPCVLVTVGSGVLGVIFGFFVPMFRKGMFSRLDKLPGITEFVLGVSDLVSHYGLILLALVIAGVVTLWRLRKNEDVRRRASVLRTRAPVLGPLTRALAAARFCRLLGTMESNGVPLLTAMTIARDAAGNALMEDAIDEAIEAVRAGDPLAGPLGTSGLFGEDVVEMISVGEAAGNVDAVLLTIAETLEGRVERLLSGAVKLIEPLLLVVIAGAIGLVAVALILPMMQMTANV